MKVKLKNEKTGEIKEVKIGWSWTLFLFSGFFGLPLFLRKLNVLGGVFLALWIVNFIAPMLVSNQNEAVGIRIVMSLIFLGLEIWLGIKGNEITAKNYLENGWVFANPEDDIVKIAKGKWGIG